MTLADDVADDVRRRMDRRGLSARELARRAGIPATLLHRALAGRRSLALDELEALAVVLETRPEVMLRAVGRRRMASPDRVTCSGSNSEPRQE